MRTRLRNIGKGAQYLGLLTFALLLSLFVSEGKDRHTKPGWYSDINFNAPRAEADITTGGDGGCGGGSCSSTGGCPDAPDGGQ